MRMLLGWLLGAVFVLPSTGSEATDIDVRQAQLFLDDYVIESTQLVERVLHQPIRYSLNPLLSPEMPWEGNSLNYLGGVCRDEESGLFRAWYVGVYSGGVPDMPDLNFAICLITSHDGMTWTRPDLEKYSHLTGGPNNIVLHLEDGCTAAPQILYDKEDSERPWKLVIHHSPKTPCKYNVRLASSKDGIDWEWDTTDETAVYAKFHDRLTAMLDKSDSDYPYVLFSRPALSFDYPLLYPDRVRIREVFQTRLARDGRSISRDPELTLRPDLEDPPETEFYHFNAYRYESIFIGSLFLYQSDRPPRGEVQLAVSRDLKRWSRVRPRTPFMAAQLAEGRPLGVWDAGCVQPTLSPPISHEGALWFYYLGGPAFHGSRFLKGELRLGLAKLRVDGFASLRARWREGVVTTKAFVWPGGSLTLNCENLGTGATREDSWIRLSVLDEEGLPLRGYSRDESDQINGDFLDVKPTWSGEEQDLAGLIGKNIRLRFFLKQADVFSFRSTGRETLGR